MIGDSQVRAEDAHVAALELIDEQGRVGLGFIQSLFVPLPPEAEITRVFRFEAWPTLEDERAQALVHRVARPRGGNQRAWTLPFHEALQVALWDLAAKQAGLPLWQLLGARRDRVNAYASGLDFHLSDTAFSELFGRADALGYRAFKIKVGHHDFERDLHRLDLLKKAVRRDAQIMIDANEAWSPKEAVMKLERIRDAGHALLWVEDPTLRNDFAGLRHIRQAAPWTALNTGEYLDASGKRALMQADAVDLLNVHGQVTDVMRIGWLAAELGVPVTVGNTFLEVGVHCACALPETEWLEYSFQNFDALVEEPIPIRDGVAIAPEQPGHGLVLSEYARRELRRPDVFDASELGPPPLGLPEREIH
ncbi:mandelate racemase/muconate lactonizing enzyme family protein [Pararobbsia silviterrae]|uniref:mandelate racemase/muconate lactonizing enzyme family protein n=1 Tax=Pararobbsia silviterrae TaxID=1792498 RepID=UPI001F0CA6BC|nr:mandelate racemase/muconate lactonizing enzyme family protein [Pararobbsia silviterrae]